MSQCVIDLGDKRPLGNKKELREESQLPNYVAKSVSKEDNKNSESKRRISSQGW